MQAVVFNEFGHSDVLRLAELPDPEPGPGEVLVDVTATALNHLDVDVREGTSRFPVECPHVPGVEPVGRIAALGEGVEGWKVGDRVAVYLIATCGSCRYCVTGRESLCTAPDWFVGMGSPGAYAERVTCKTSQLIRVPDGVSDVEAAATNIAFATAWHMLVTRARLRPGESVLVSSVGSGIGSAAVQVAKLAGAFRDRHLEPRGQAREGEGAGPRRRDRLHEREDLRGRDARDERSGRRRRLRARRR